MREVRDPFIPLRYHSMHSRHITHYEDEEEQRKRREETANAEILSREESGEYIFAFWGGTDVSKLSLAAMASNTSSLNREASENLQLV